MTSENNGVEQETYKLQSIRVDVRLYKLVNVPIYHPLGYHYELIIGHCHA